MIQPRPTETYCPKRPPARGKKRNRHRWRKKVAPGEKRVRCMWCGFMIKPKKGVL